MITSVITVIAALVGIIGGILERRYAKDAVLERAKAKRDEAIAKRNATDLSNILNDLHSHVRRQNRSHTGQQGADSSSDKS